MVWVTFLGGAAATRRGAQMTITEFLDKLGPGGRRAADGAIQSLCLGVLGLLAWYGMGIVNATWGNELTVLHIPMALQYLALPVGAAAMARSSAGTSCGSCAGARAPSATGRARMFSLILVVVFFTVALAGVPLMFALLTTTVGMIWAKGLSHPLETIFLSFIGGVEPFILIAVPLFIVAGELLSQGGVGKRIVQFARALFGFLPGGLGVVTVASCLMFGGVSGSAIADTAAIGSLVIPTMIQRGYSRAFAAALLAVAGTLALLMPLSIPFLVYAFISGVSMRQLSMAGVVPAFISAAALIAVCVWYGRKTGCDNGDERSSRQEIWAAFKDAGPAL